MEYDLRGWVDLGLPSGKLWCFDNEEGYFTFDEAVEKFQDQLPTIEDWQELFAECEIKRKYDKIYGDGIEFIATNGNKLFLPFAGRYVNSIYDLQCGGYYWADKKTITGTPVCVHIDDSNYEAVESIVTKNWCASVRLIKTE